MSEMIVQSETLDKLAQKINEKTGQTGKRSLAQLEADVDGIQSGGNDDLVKSIFYSPP